MPDKGKLLSPEDGREIAAVYYDIYADIAAGDGRKPVGEFSTDTELDPARNYVIRLQNAMQMDCTVELCKAGPDGFGYRLYII